MPFAITLCLDPISAEPLQNMWRALAAAGIDRDRTDLGYAPHLTLAIFPDKAPEARLRAAVAAMPERWRAMPVALSGFGIFPGPASVIWAVPVVTAALLACHRALLAALPGLEPDLHYRVDAWVPHVTLSGPLPDPGRGLGVLIGLWRPMEGVLDRIELARFRPVEILDSRLLPG